MVSIWNYPRFAVSLGRETCDDGIFDPAQRPAGGGVHFEYRFAFISEPGEMGMTEAEAENFRVYVDRGSFIRIGADIVVHAFTH